VVNVVASIRRYDSVTLEDNNRYVVTHVLEENGIHYLCMVGNNNSRILIGKEVEQEDTIVIETLTDDKEIQTILKRLFSHI